MKPSASTLAAAVARGPHRLHRLVRIGLACSVAAALWLHATRAEAEVAVIVHPSNAARLDEDAVAKIFLGQVKTFPDGNLAAPADQRGGAAVDEFRAKVLKKTPVEIRRLWARQVFTGGLVPPRELDGDDAVLQFVAATPNAIGYVDAAKLNGSVKAVLKK